VSGEPGAPPRLLEGVGPGADCLRQVLLQSASVALPRFAELRERRLQRARRQRGVSLLALAVGTVSCVLALRKEEPRPRIYAEVVYRPSGKQAVSASSAAPSEVQRQAEPTTKLAPAPETALAAKVKSNPPRPAGEMPSRLDEHAPGDTEPEPAGAAGGAKACAQLARHGAAEEALGCYQKLAGGSGMSAELALFEQARLEGKVLRRPELAERTLSEYRRRFPQGSLRAEVMLAQIDWLVALGNSARALQLVDEALGSGLLRERTAELERLRTTLLAVPPGRD